jgi:lysophospholipase L1-like esterase
MDFFKNYVSNTLAGTSNQLYFDNTDAMGTPCTCMSFYKVTAGGEFDYSILFSNAVDSTYAQGLNGKPNMILDDFNILSVKIGVLSKYAKALPESVERHTKLFCVDVKKYVHDNEVTYFETEPIRLNANEDDYIVISAEYVGTRIPCHVEAIIPGFKKTCDGWVADKRIPFANTVGIKRSVTARVAYLGDSITQGIGVEENDYSFWNAILSKKLGNGFSYWNLGIGYARCQDAATDGAWLFKAKQADYVFVCLGANDLLSENADACTLSANIERVVERLNEAGCKVILQTVPPFSDYSDENIKVWYEVNEYIKNKLSLKVLAVFDQGDILMTDERIPNKVLYGGHPNAVGCRLWGDALYEFISEKIDVFGK